jgi:hypothetical protein
MGSAWLNAQMSPCSFLFLATLFAHYFAVFVNGRQIGCCVLRVAAGLNFDPRDHRTKAERLTIMNRHLAFHPHLIDKRAVARATFTHDYFATVNENIAMTGRHRIVRNDEGVLFAAANRCSLDDQFVDTTLEIFVDEMQFRHKASFPSLRSDTSHYAM